MMNRDDMMARRDELMQRAEELRERFADNVTQETVSTAAAWTMVSTGVALGLTMWMRGRRGMLALLFPVALVFGGIALLGNGAWHRRGRSILETEARVREELAGLDPIARLQVMRDIAPGTMPFIRSTHN